MKIGIPIILSLSLSFQKSFSRPLNHCNWLSSNFQRTINRRNPNSTNSSRGRSFSSFISTPKGHQIRSTIPVAMTPPSAVTTGLLSENAAAKITLIESIIGTDAGDRGMKALIVPNDLHQAAITFTSLTPNSYVVILSGFPCCVNHSPPTETDGPPGAISIARTALSLGHNVILVTDECNEIVFRAAAECLPDIEFEIFPDEKSMKKEDEERMKSLVEKTCDLIISCERAGPAKDGVCYTMRGINMNEKGLIAPIHKIVDMARDLRPEVKYIAIGDGGNEMGMGKVIDRIRNSDKIKDGDKIGAVTLCDFLIAASVSNWGGYALSGSCAVVKNDEENGDENVDWVNKLVPSEEEEVALLERCVKMGCRDGVSGQMEATVDGMPLERSMECLRDIREAGY